MSWQNFAGQQFTYDPPPSVKRAYSVTADVLAYKTCSLQYGVFRGRKYEPATVPQLFWGMAIHQVLDMAHAHYRGQVGPQVPGSMPSDTDIEQYFLEVERSLRARQIGVMRNIRDQALELVQRFNRLEGPVLYPMVVDTECRLQADQGAYVLQGTVDVIRMDDSEPPAIEIWDYKGTENPGMGSSQYQMYEYQMQVYAELYRRKTGCTPASVALYFLNELRGSPEPTSRPTNAVLRIPIDPTVISTAMSDFSEVVQSIESNRAARSWPLPTIPPDRKTCNGCDLRWTCSVCGQAHGNPSMIYP